MKRVFFLKVYLFFDTNILFVKSHSDYTALKFLDNLDFVINDIINNNFQDNVEILLPRIVINELIQQQILGYNNEIEKIKNKKFPCFSVETHQDYEKYLENILSERLNFYTLDKAIKITILPYPQANSFNYIIDRAIKKKPPFEGLEKISDKGFKDAVLWETILEYKKQYTDKAIVLCSNDGKFHSEDLRTEYEDIFSDEYRVLKWHPGENVLLDTLGDMLNLTVEQSVKSKLVNRFSDLIKHSNLDLLYKGLKYPYQMNENIYTFKDLKVLNVNSISDIQEFENNSRPYKYFVVEMYVKLNFVEERYLELNIEHTISIKDYYEYEIYYYPDTDIFSVISFDPPFDESYDNKELLLSKKL